jgi:hypothetical protein
VLEEPCLTIAWEDHRLWLWFADKFAATVRSLRLRYRGEYPAMRKVTAAVAFSVASSLVSLEELTLNFDQASARDRTAKTLLEAILRALPFLKWLEVDLYGFA